MIVLWHVHVLWHTYHFCCSVRQQVKIWLSCCDIYMCCDIRNIYCCAVKYYRTKHNCRAVTYVYMCSDRQETQLSRYAIHMTFLVALWHTTGQHMIVRCAVKYRENNCRVVTYMTFIVVLWHTGIVLLLRCDTDSCDVTYITLMSGCDLHVMRVTCRRSNGHAVSYMTFIVVLWHTGIVLLLRCDIHVMWHTYVLCQFVTFTCCDIHKSYVGLWPTCAVCDMQEKTIVTL